MNALDWSTAPQNAEVSGTESPPSARLDSSIQAGEAAIAQSRTSRKTRSDAGKPRGPRSNSRGTSGAFPESDMSPELRAAMEAQFEHLFDKEAWGALLSLPADAALALGGNERWDIKDNERKTLGACGSTAARFLAIKNPRAMAMMMLSAAVLSVYGPRLAGTMKDLMAAKRAKSNATVVQTQPNP